jgi:hypothetical protein
MANVGPVCPLRIEGAMGANTGLPVQGFVPNGLLDCNLANQPSSSGKQRPPNCTPSSPVRQNESLDSSRAGSGAYKCNLLLFPSPNLKEQTTRLLYLVTFHRRHKVRFDPLKRSSLLILSGDDDLPDISDLLRPYLRPRAGTDTAATTSSAPIVLPRPSLPSSTFDGKTIFLKRKSRIIAASVRVPVRRCTLNPTHAPL